MTPEPGFPVGCECANCDWREYRLHILESLKGIQASIKDLHAEISNIHLEVKEIHNGKAPAEKKQWPPWKYVLLGAAIAIPQIALEIFKL